MLALGKYESDVHYDGCGLHHSVAMTDPHLKLEMEICPSCASAAHARRAQEEADKKATEGLGPLDKWPTDGRRFKVVEKTPDEVAADEAKKAEKPMKRRPRRRRP